LQLHIIFPILFGQLVFLPPLMMGLGLARQVIKGYQWTYGGLGSSKTGMALAGAS
jgi:hypothetical protein